MLELRNISKKFGDKQILKDFNLIVPEKASVGHCWTFWRREDNPSANAGRLGDN